MQAILDHIVINARARMGRAHDVFSGLGFTLTPRGEHSLGSINNLMMFDTDYLEILGVPRDDASIRPDLYTSPFGLNGLVFKTRDADEAFAQLQACGMAGEPPRAFSRPVVLADGTSAQASFRTVTARPDSFPAGRLYFCDHQTPEHVWRDEWLGHPGGVTGFTELVHVSPRPEDDAEKAGRLLSSTPQALPVEGFGLTFENGFRLTFLTSDAYLARFGSNARLAQDRDVYFGALGLRCTSVDRVRQNAREIDGVTVSDLGSSLAVSVADLDTLLIFDI